jgi:hypothetical protein
MTKLNDAAKAVLRDAGISQAAWLRANGYADGAWGGGACGCPDDRCKDGYHHYPGDECGCLRALLDGLVEMRLSGSGMAAAVVAEILRANKAVEVLTGPDLLGDGRQSLIVRVMSPERVIAALSASRVPAEDARLLDALHPDRDEAPARDKSRCLASQCPPPKLDECQWPRCAAPGPRLLRTRARTTTHPGRTPRARRAGGPRRRTRWPLRQRARPGPATTTEVPSEA